MKRLATSLVNVIIMVTTVLSAAAFILPVIFGAKPVVVLSGSMEPTLNVGGVALMERVDPTSLRVGDIITFQPPGNTKVMITHRITDILSQSPLIFQTQGDAVGTPDAFTVPSEIVKGRVRFHIPQAGFLMHRLAQDIRTPLGFGLTMGVAGAVLIGGEVRNILSLTHPCNRRARLMKKRAQRLKKRRPRAVRRIS